MPAGPICEGYPSMKLPLPSFDVFPNLIKNIGINWHKIWCLPPSNGTFIYVYGGQK